MTPSQGPDKVERVHKSLKPEPLRQAIADSISANVKAYNVPAFCREIGLAAGDEDSAWASKAVYVAGLLQGWDLAGLLDVAQRVLGQWDDEELEALVGLAGLGGAGGGGTSRT